MKIDIRWSKTTTTGLSISKQKPHFHFGEICEILDIQNYSVQCPYALEKPWEFLFKILFIYSSETHRERQRHRQREKQVPRGEPDVRLHPRSLGSCPEPEADAQPLSYSGAPSEVF